MPGENTRFDVGRATGAKVNHKVEGLALIEGRFFRSPGFQRNAQKTHDHCNQAVSSAMLRAHSLPPLVGLLMLQSPREKSRSVWLADFHTPSAQRLSNAELSNAITGMLGRPLAPPRRTQAFRL